MNELKIVQQSELLTPDEAANYLKIKKSTIYQMSFRKTLPVCKIGKLLRFRKQDLEHFICQNLSEVKTVG